MAKQAPIDPEFPPSPREIARRLRRFCKSTRYFAAESRSLREMYPNSWIAILDGQLLAHAKTLSGIRTKIQAKGLPDEGLLVEYLDTSDKVYIL